MTTTPELRHCFYCGDSLARGVDALWIATCGKPECQRAFHDEIRAVNDSREKGKS